MVALQLSEGFQNLDFKTQTIITKLDQGLKTIDELKPFIHHEIQSIKGHVTSEFQQRQRDLEGKQYRQHFLESLWYSEIYRRQETVSEAHRNTFQWVYEADGFDRSARPWASLVQWLEQGSGIYWISGKAGSGKSTLMNYICQDDRTTNSLKVWSDAKEVFTPVFFFWNAGSTLEKSSEGLLRSLLYQILQKFPNLIPRPYNHHSNMDESADCQYKSQSIAAWTERRLHMTIQKVMQLVQEECHTCIFIDGLDEVSGDPDTLIAMIDNLQSAKVKLCLTSRPDRSYTDAFSSYAMLRLQDLTEPDIRTYVWDELQPLLPADSSGTVSKICDNVVTKAQGVFLWVRLVVKGLIRGLKNDDNLDQLRIRVASLPSDIEALYIQMLDNIEIAHRPEAALLFSMALAGLTKSLMDVTFALSKEVYHMSTETLQDIMSRCIRTRQRMPTVCAGLLEFHLGKLAESKHQVHFNQPCLTLPFRYISSVQTPELTLYERYAHVGFLHRTASDFLRDSKQGQLFLETNSQFGNRPYPTYVRAQLAKLTLLGFPEKPASANAVFEENFDISIYDCVDGRHDEFVDRVARRFVYRIMHYVRWEEQTTANAQVSLCNDIDHTLTSIYQRHVIAPQHSHWSSRWRKNFQCDSSFKPPTSSRLNLLATSHSPSRTLSRCTYGPVDFLGFAASLGLSYYVFEMIEVPETGCDKQIVTYLLRCCLYDPGFRIFFPPPQEFASSPLDFLNGLLTSGANPNEYVEEYSSTFLERFMSRIVWDQVDQKALIATVKTFLENSGDVHCAVRTQLVVPETLQERCRLKGMIFGLERSILFTIRSELKDTPELKSLEGIIIARGGKDHLRFTHFSFDKHDYRPLEISEQQNYELIAAFGLADLGHCASTYGQVTDRGCEIAYRVGTIFKEILERDGKTKRQMVLDDDNTSNIDTEEDFYDAISIQDVENA